MSFLRSVFSVSSLTIVSRITGYMRDLLLVHLIGANAISDAIVIVIKIPSFFRRIFAEGAFHSSFLPSYTQTQKNKVFAGMILSLLLGVLGCLVLGVELYYAPLSDWLLSDTHPVTLGYVKQFGPIVFPFIFFISVVAFCGSILNAHGRFSALALSQSIGNITVLIFVWTLSGFTTQTGLLFAWGVFISGIIQSLFIIWNCWKNGYLITPCWPRWTPDVKKFLKRFFPGFLTIATTQIHILIVPLFLLSRLPDGSLSYLQYADRLNQLPLSIIGIALSSVLLPMLSEKIKSNDQDGANMIVSQALRFAWIVTLPSMIVLSLCAFPMVITLFSSDKLTTDQLITISNTVNIGALGIPAYIIVKIFTARCFAASDMMTPLMGGVVASVIDVVLAMTLVDYLHHFALALASSMASWGYALFLISRLMVRDGWVFPKELRLFFLRAIAAALFSVVSVLLMIHALGSFEGLSLWRKIIQLILLVGTCGITFLLGLWKMGFCSPEMIQTFTHYFRKKKS